MIPGKAKRLIL